MAAGWFMDTEPAPVVAGSCGVERSVVATCAESMLEHPVFVYWCVTCGQEAEENVPVCIRCGGRVQGHQRIRELPDDPPSPDRDPSRKSRRCRRDNGNDGLLSLRSLRAALADVVVSEGVGDSAVLLFEQGADPGVAAACPELARRLADLGVPPAVQRALVSSGFVHWDQIAAAVANSRDVDALATQLGVASPAAEVLLRRLRTAVVEASGHRALRQAHPDKRSQDDGMSDDLCVFNSTTTRLGVPAGNTARVASQQYAKKLRVPQEMDTGCWHLPWDGEMKAIEDEDTDEAAMS